MDAKGAKPVWDCFLNLPNSIGALERVFAPRHYLNEAARSFGNFLSLGVLRALCGKIPRALQLRTKG
jgi:hypothetical protein